MGAGGAFSNPETPLSPAVTVTPLSPALSPGSGGKGGERPCDERRPSPPLSPGTGGKGPGDRGVTVTGGTLGSGASRRDSQGGGEAGRFVGIVLPASPPPCSNPAAAGASPPGADGHTHVDAPGVTGSSKSF